MSEALARAESIKAHDPADSIWEDVGDVSKVDVFLNDVLVAIYERKMVGRLGIIHSAAPTQKADQHMGKVGLILKLGPGVDVDDSRVEFFGRKLAVGDWVAFMPGDGWPVKIRDQRCRMLPDHRIRMRIPKPDLVTE